MSLGGSWQTLVVNQLRVLAATLHRQGTLGHRPRLHIPRAEPTPLASKGAPQEVDSSSRPPYLGGPLLQLPH
uniref:Uncharacterized protein n=1 Tax=Saccharum officinarum TaxID=4547 RepID=A0A678T6C3_SACOF|nr:hypothetical protein SO171L14_000007 [Saccharum officinarum]